MKMKGERTVFPQGLFFKMFQDIVPAHGLVSVAFERKTGEGSRVGLAGAM